MGKRTKTTTRVKPPLDIEKSASEGGPDTLKIRKLIDGELGRTMGAYQQQLVGANPYRLLEFASRCAERVWRLGVVLRLRKPEASRPIRLVTGLTPLAARLAEEAANDPGRLKQTETAKEAKDANHDITSAEIEIYLADRWSHAILELGRVAGRLLEAVEAFYEGDEGLLSQLAASVAAHAEQAMMTGLGADAAKTIGDAIHADLAAISGGNPSMPFPGIRPIGDDLLVKNLSKEELSQYNNDGLRYQNISVAKIRFQQSQEPPPGLESLTVPKLSPGDESTIGDPKFFKLAAKVEERTRVRQQKQIDDLQGFLNLLAGKSFGSQEAHKGLAEFITKFAARANANLTISGEFTDPKDKKNRRVFTLEPITVRCDNPKTKSLMIRSIDNQRTHITNTTTFPKLYAIPKR